MISSPVTVWYGIVGLLLLLIQMQADFIAVEQITPDLIVLFVIYLAVREGQFVGLLAGFAMGLLFDLVSSDINGLNALAKMLAGFAAGFFYREEASLQEAVGTPRFLWITAGASLLHNIVYYFFYVRPSQLEFLPFFLRYGLAFTLYTTVFSLVVMLVVARKRVDA